MTEHDFCGKYWFADRWESTTNSVGIAMKDPTAGLNEDQKFCMPQLRPRQSNKINR